MLNIVNGKERLMAVNIVANHLLANLLFVFAFSFVFVFVYLFS